MTSTGARPQQEPYIVPCAVIFLIAFAIRLAYAYARPIPVSADAAYYLMVAENLHHGRGFVADYVWHYLAGIPDGLPVPSNSYWMPGTSLVTAGAFAIARDTSLRVAQYPSLIFGALLCAIAAWIAGALTRRREAALLAGAAAAVSYYLVQLSLFPDHFMLNAVLVNLSLLALWAAWRERASLALLAGALAALAYLTRTDGAILAFVALCLAIASRRRVRKSRPIEIVVYFLIAFSLVSLPWWTRQTLVFGHPSGAGALRTAFLTNYDDLFRVDHSHLTLHDYLQTSQVVATGMKAYAFYRSLRILARALMLFSALAVAALWLRDLRREAVPWLAYLPLALIISCF
ncbi:MAG TPA: glycosyltransferase family 39 protein, partial [Armatimonadota bacterium]|nr:glycosyltransferase family 39 protein [Armatimonadota bacterium]